MKSITIKDIETARSRIRDILPVSPLTESYILEDVSPQRIFLKWENKFKTGSFKERGAAHFLNSLNAEEKKKGVCAASAGNHAMALSFHAYRLGIPCTIVMPTSAPLVKVERTKNFRAEVFLRGDSFDDAYEFALRYADDNQLLYVPAFDHPAIIAGQGTIGLELLEQCPDLDCVIVPIGGGGLISGIATALKHHKPDIHVVGVRSSWADSRRKKKEKDSALLPTVSIADGIAVKRPGGLTEPIIEKLVDDICVVSEDHIVSAIIRFLEVERSVVEGAGAAGLAAAMQGCIPAESRCCAICVCGSNIDSNVLSRLIQRDMANNDRIIQLHISVPDRPGALSIVTRLIADEGANVLDVFHERPFSESPTFVDITVMAEVRNAEHGEAVRSALERTGVMLVSQTRGRGF